RARLRRVHGPAAVRGPEPEPPGGRDRRRASRQRGRRQPAPVVRRPETPEMAKAITGGLAAADPANRPAYMRALASFVRSLKPLDDAVTALRSKHAGAPVAYTEPVPGYLLEAAGLVVRTPDAFARAIEDGIDPTPQAVSQM